MLGFFFPFNPCNIHLYLLSPEISPGEIGGRKVRREDKHILKVYDPLFTKLTFTNSHFCTSSEGSLSKETFFLSSSIPAGLLRTELGIKISCHCGEDSWCHWIGRRGGGSSQPGKKDAGVGIKMQPSLENKGGTALCRLETIASES